MKPSLEKLIKFIKLEAERGYDNRAVVGGLEKIYTSWEAEARAESLPDDLIKAVGARLRDYSQLTPPSRADMLQGLWKRIQRVSGSNLPSLPQPPDREEAAERPAARPARTAERPAERSADRSGDRPRPERSAPPSAGQKPAQNAAARPARPARPITTEEPTEGETPKAPEEPTRRRPDERRPSERRPQSAGQQSSGQQPTGAQAGGAQAGGAQSARQSNQGNRQRGAERPNESNRRTERPKTVRTLESDATGQELGRRTNPAYKPSIHTPIEQPVDFAQVDEDTAHREEDGPIVERPVTPIGQLSPVTLDLPAFQPTAQQFDSSQGGDDGSAEQDAQPAFSDQKSAWANAPRRTRAVTEGTPAALNAPVTVLPGVGPRHAETIANLGLRTLGDMLYFFPRRYLDYSQLRPINRLFYGEVVTVLGMVESASLRPARSGKLQLVEAVVSDGSGSLRVTWFNQPWLIKRLHNGVYVSLSGKVEQYLGRLAMNNPEIELLDQDHLHTNRIVPVYSLTASITQHWLRGLMHQVVTYWAGRVRDPLTDQLRRSAELLDLPNALLQAHFPDSLDMLKAARHRLAFDEIFLLQIGVLRQKSRWLENTAQVFTTASDWLETQTARLPYLLTGAQMRALQDIQKDLASGRPMNRLLQGDVGSGKTIVAALSMALLASQGVQAALMAPTSILAEQHYKNLRRVLCPIEGQEDPNAPLHPDQIRLMVGATSEAEKAEIRVGLESGAIRLVIGTHALIEDPVNFQNLELVIIDEQHRFGVQQRSALRSKGRSPHLLVMTATPIPRSLALTVYGDLDLSILDEMPPGRQPIETQVFLPRERERAYTLIRSQIEQGHQAFIIYPLVEETEKSEGQAAVEEHARLQKQVFSKLKLGLLHGRLKPEEKDSVMADFRDGKTQILVSTSVVEVGVDVPNATVMLIEGANRFGLSQLHQFRGRVGRGSAASYCALIPESSDDGENERLSAMVETNDGFILAERDLEQRGPGEFLGTRQSGYHSELRLASLTDVRLIEKARHHAQQIFASDPELAQPENQALAAAVDRFWDEGQGDIS